MYPPDDKPQHARRFRAERTSAGPGQGCHRLATRRCVEFDRLEAGPFWQIRHLTWLWLLRTSYAVSTWSACSVQVGQNISSSSSDGA